MTTLDQAIRNAERNQTTARVAREFRDSGTIPTSPDLLAEFLKHWLLDVSDSGDGVFDPLEKQLGMEHAAQLYDEACRRLNPCPDCAGTGCPACDNSGHGVRDEDV